MTKGKLIVIDGTDGSGKATQVALLKERLIKENHHIQSLDFPQYYNNFFGGMVGDALAGRLGDWAGTDPKIASVIYAADRFESSKQIQEWLDSGIHVILDRYVSSNQIHQGARLLMLNSGASLWHGSIQWNMRFLVFQGRTLFYT